MFRNPKFSGKSYDPDLTDLICLDCGYEFGKHIGLECNGDEP